MIRGDEKKILEKEIESLNEEIKKLGHKLSAIFDLDCSFAV